jgi:hypothetical protein
MVFEYQTIQDNSECRMNVEGDVHLNAHEK